MSYDKPMTEQEKEQVLKEWKALHREALDHIKACEEAMDKLLDMRAYLSEAFFAHEAVKAAHWQVHQILNCEKPRIP